MTTESCDSMNLGLEGFDCGLKTEIYPKIWKPSEHKQQLGGGPTS